MEAPLGVLFKADKEAFVYGLEGTSKSEVFGLVVAASFAAVLGEALTSRLPGNVVVPRLLLEWVAVAVLQVLLCTSALPLWPTFTTLALCTVAAFTRRAQLGGRVAPEEARAAAQHELAALGGRRKTFVSTFRGSLMAYTCVCILAVDFTAFPRRYAKAETYGTGLMDVGVGGIMLAAGLVGPVAAGAAAAAAAGAGGGAEQGPAGAGAPGRSPPLLRRLVTGLRSAAVCLLLGLARLVSTRAVNYQEHVGEYGVHWNFFDTIALTTLAGHLVLLRPERQLPLALALTAGHQALLSLGGLGAWALSPHRGTDLLSANKEGLVSCLGYWALYVWGGALAHVMQAGVTPAVRAAKAQLEGGAESAAAAPSVTRLLVRWMGGLVALDAAMWAALGALEAYVEPASRRSCNAAYIVWLAAQMLATLLPLAAWQAAALAVQLRAATQPARAPGSRGQAAAAGRQRWPASRILHAINRNQLAVFLLANVLTGLVNLSIPTMQVREWPARLLLCGYMGVVCGAAVALDAWGVRLKL